MRAVMIGVMIGVSPALADTMTCSTFAGVRTCLGGHGFMSHETTWNGITTGSDNRGDRWTTSRWRDIGTTTV
jgi:hypothetical protein